jgi:hypothetical protein
LKKLLYYLVIFLICPGYVFSAPSVTGVSGVIAKDETITISGSGFGAHADYSPNTSHTLARAWNNFESGAVLIDDWQHGFGGLFSDNWTLDTGSINRGSSSYTAARRWNSDSRGALEINQSGDQSAWYASFYFRVDSDCPTSGSQGKFMRIYGNNNNNFY